ncbi:MAG TPA: hypothetical protein VGU73_06670 [Acidimicrobiia bacterium]|nr:hypothetical protein [Acidimicrobiia bacterium]
MRLWLLRVVWITLPLTAAPALREGVRDWGTAAQVVAATLCWAVWGIGVVTLLAPRPAGLTFLRTAAPALVASVAVASASGHASVLAAAGGLAATLVASLLAADSEFAIASANAVAYGDEQRYPLRVPPALFVGPLPVVRLVVVAGVVAGPLMLASGRYLAGGIAVVVGFPIAWAGGRALHRLTRRWLVLVPAGVVVVDRMSLVDNVLFPREHIQLLQGVAADASPGAALDVRMGATLGSVVATFDEPAELVLAPRPGRESRTVKAPAIVVAVTRRREVLQGAARRRVRVEVDAAPPRSSAATTG